MYTDEPLSVHSGFSEALDCSGMAMVMFIVLCLHRSVLVPRC